MKKAKVLVTGFDGFIGTRLKEIAEDKLNLIGFRHSPRQTVTDFQFISDLVKDVNPDVILHLAAKTHIDHCEEDKLLGKKSVSWQVNVTGTKNIAKAASMHKKHLIYLSTECVFDGKKRWYQEEDKKNPLNWYGYTKKIGEGVVSQSGAKYCVLRSTLAYGHPHKFKYDLFRFFTDKIKKKQKITAVSDQLLSLTFIDDLINVISTLIAQRAEGVYHYAGSEGVSPFSFAQILEKKLKKSGIVQPVLLDDFFASASRLRLKNATLSSAKIKKDFNISPSDLKKGIRKAFAHL